MNNLSTARYKNDLIKAVRCFWETCNAQFTRRSKADQGNKSAVTGGKQMNGFVDLLVKVSEDLGVPRECIYTKGNILPGFFSPCERLGFYNYFPYQSTYRCY